MNTPDSFEDFQRRCEGYRGWHGSMPRPSAPEPEPGLRLFGRLRWYVHEYLRPKSGKERVAIKLVKTRRA